MATLTVFKFETPDGAEKAVTLMSELQKQRLIEVQDAATVSWETGKKKPKTKHLTHMTRVGALDGAFWGTLFGLIFFMPFFGLVVGAAVGALAGKFSDYGIGDDFIKSVREKVTEGTSALFLLSSKAVVDKVVEAAKSLPKFELLTSNLSQAQEDQLRETFQAAA